MSERRTLPRAGRPHVRSLFLLMLVPLFGCSSVPRAPSEPGTAASPEPVSPAPAGAEPTPTTEEPNPAATPAAASTPAAPPPESLLSSCNKMCDAVAPKCTALQLEGCRSTCKNYEEAPPACDATVRAALDCARQDRDFLFCSNVIPITCAKHFKNLNVCMATGVAPVETVKKAIPDGWERFEAKDAPFSVVMPKGVTSKTEDGVKKWSVEAPNGAHYEVALHPAPPADKKLDNKAFLKVSRTLFGRCADKMKLHAIVEKPTETSIQFKTSCPEKTEQVGRMHVVSNALYLLTLKFPTGTTVEIDPFVYSFEARK